MTVTKDKLRVVVVGLGRAGRARVAALAGHPRAVLAGVARRRPGPGEVGLGAVMAGLECDAAILCTPNLKHAEQARELLERGVHVAVEFPLAATPAEARALFTLARQRDVVLHVEHIEVLAASQASQRRRAGELGRPVGGALLFQGGSAEWIGDPVLAGSPALRALARLHRLIDVFGEAAIESARLDVRPGGQLLEVEFAFSAGGRTRLVEERGPDLQRVTSWEVECEHGRLDDPPDEDGGSPLFRADLDVFLERIEHGAPAYVSEARELHLLELVEEIERRAGNRN